VGSVVEVGDTWRIYYSCQGSVGLATIGRHRLYGLEILPGRKSGEITSIALEPANGGWTVVSKSMPAVWAATIFCRRSYGKEAVACRASPSRKACR